MAVEEEDGEESAAAPKKKGGGLKIIIILAVLLFVFIGIAVGGLIAYNKVLAPSLGLPPLFGGGGAEGEKGSESGEPEVLEKTGGMHPLPPFIVNLAEAAGNRFIKVTLQLELSNKEMAKELTERLPQIQDQIITVLSSKKMDEVLTADGKFRLKSEMMTRVNQFLRTGKVSNIFYTEFVVQ